MGKNTGSIYAADTFNSTRSRVESAGKLNFDEGIRMKRQFIALAITPQFNPNPENVAVFGGRESMKKIFLFLSSTLLVFTARATTVATFTDDTFNLANYSESIGNPCWSLVSKVPVRASSNQICARARRYSGDCGSPKWCVPVRHIRKHAAKTHLAVCGRSHLAS